MVERRIQKGELLVWVSPGLKTLKITHDELGPYELQMTTTGVGPIQSLNVYKITIQGTFKPGSPKTEKPKQQYLAFRISPPNAILEVNGQIWEVAHDGTAMKFVKFGTYDYRVYAKDYHTNTGKVTVNNPDETEKVTVTLNPNYGWIEVKGKDDLQDASVYVDDNYVGRAPCRSEALKSGAHTVRVVKEMYANYSQTVLVNDNETTTISPALTADFAEVTLKVDADAEIWVNDELKGVRSWKGRLGSGTYKIECKQASHETTLTTKEINPGMSGSTITLSAPNPIYGSLNVESTPGFAKLFIDGKAMGETPKFISEILVGKHEIRLTMDGYADYTETITITKDERKQVKASLNDGKEIRFICNVAKAQLEIDGKYVGPASSSYCLTYGNHVFKATAPNYLDYTGNILVNENTFSQNITLDAVGKQTQKVDASKNTKTYDKNKVLNSRLYKRGQENMNDGNKCLLMGIGVGVAIGVYVGLVHDPMVGLLGGAGIIASGALIASPFWIVGSVQKNKAKKMGYLSLLEYDIPIHDNITLGTSLGTAYSINMPETNGLVNTVPGVGISLNF